MKDFCISIFIQRVGSRAMSIVLKIFDWSDFETDRISLLYAPAMRRNGKSSEEKNRLPYSIRPLILMWSTHWIKTAAMKETRRQREKRKFKFLVLDQLANEICRSFRFVYYYLLPFFVPLTFFQMFFSSFFFNLNATGSKSNQEESIYS